MKFIVTEQFNDGRNNKKLEFSNPVTTQPYSTLLLSVKETGKEKTCRKFLGPVSLPSLMLDQVDF